MPAYTLKGIETEASIATLERKGTHYDYLEIAEEGGRVCRLYDVFVPLRLQADNALRVIGNFAAERETRRFAR
jgi:hypothetical protein